MSSEYKPKQDSIKWLLENGWTLIANQMINNNKEKNFAELKENENIYLKGKGETQYWSDDAIG